MGNKQLPLAYLAFRKCELASITILRNVAHALSSVARGPGAHQIYRDLNRAMRRRHPPDLELWRPFIYFLDVALQKLGCHSRPGAPFKCTNSTQSPEKRV